MPWAGFEAKVCRKVSRTLAMGLFQCPQTITIRSSPILPFGSETPYQKKDNPFLQSKPVGRVRVNLLMERGTKSSTNRELNMGHPTEGLHLTVPSLASRDLQTQLWMVYIGSQKTALECLGNPWNARRGCWNQVIHGTNLGVPQENIVESWIWPRYKCFAYLLPPNR